MVVGPKNNCIFRDGSRHLVGYPGGYIRILDRRAGTDLKVEAVGHDQMVAISQDGRLLGACGRKAVFLRSDGAPLRTFDNAECPIAIGPTSKHALMATKTGAVVWDVEKDEVRPFDTQISEALFSPRGDSVLVLTERGLVEHWNLDGTTIPVPETDHPVRRIGFSTDGTQALALDTMLRVWPVTDPAKARSIKIRAEQPFEILSLPKRNVIVTSGYDKIDVWTHEGQLVGSYETLDNAFLALVPGHHGNSVLAATSAQTLMDVFVPLPISDFEKSTELAEFSTLRYALAGVDDQYQRVLASKDRDGLISSFHEFADRAWALGDPETLQKALKLGEQVIGQQEDIPSVADVLAIASELELTGKFDRIMGALEPRQLLEIVELLDRNDSNGRRGQAYKKISDVIESMAARKNLPEFAPRRARRFKSEADAAVAGHQYERANGLYQKAIDANRAAVVAGPARPARAETDLDSSANAQKSLVEILISKGYANFRNNKYADAKQNWEEVAALAPGDFRAYSNIGFVEFEMGNFVKAVENFDKAIGLARPEGAEADGAADPLCGKAIALYELNQKDEAVRWYSKCIAVSDQYASAARLAANGWSEGEIGIARQILSQLSK
jgi:tetratricopeptide (TPR) repeat protein